MSITERFAIAVAASAVDMSDPELLPVRLARAAAVVLPVDGAGISLFFSTDRRLPLGASDEVSAVAERLQFTVGEGPCLSAHVSGQSIVAEEADIEASWPAFHDALVTQTPVRGIISMPFQDELRGYGALDLYLVPPHDVRTVTLYDALTVTREIVSLFHRSARPAGGEDGPAWLGAPAAERRSLVWQAMGFLNAGLDITSEDALALLRSHAYGTGSDLDDLAARVLAREVPLEELAYDDRSA
ncbi:ANTAR domain-containing protein [Geodermatophilus maliterrae]|jgi:hypothetical protein|uniref:ANTAR domain-containing protein n=1 Tax=Geodermatophilus maliterrae TaxID=3162531 RepID=A0ABV3XLM1_9ACTN